MPKRSMALIATAVFLVAACRDKSYGPERAAIHGHVRLDGQDIVAGLILFSPGDGKGQPAGGLIQNGHYAIRSADGPVLGLQTVEIRSERKTGRKIQAAMRDSGELMDETIEGIPPQFNQRSTLKYEVKSGENEANFELRSG